MKEFLTVVASIIASTGITAVVMKFFVESALKKAQEKKKIEQQRREERYKLDDEWQHNVGRVLFVDVRWWRPDGSRIRRGRWEFAGILV